ncbi:lysosomal dipeptide transporter MFSD1 isoform X7 [Agelaius phoeniceus]|uniref:lysosomal dipeptide transporter MFSD1 isoform X7 n=1 Tax=Agelaius phoeniceus TaxID=39638 RepID=UPI0040550A25
MAEEQRALLGAEGGDGSHGSPGPPRALPAACDPRRLPHRLLVLALMCFLGFGSYFCYDNPAALQTQVQRDMKVNTAQFMALYAWYSWPNVVLCFFGGFLIDRVFGIRLGTVIFSIFVCAGQVVFALGALFNTFWLMEVGRFIFGIGGESLAVAQNTYAVSWFKGKELNLVFGLQLSMARIGSTVNMNIMGWIYSRVQDLLGSAGPSTLGLALLIGGVTCLFSLSCALILAYLDRRAEKLLCKEQGKTGEVIKLTDVKDFSLSLWLIFVICVCYYAAVFPFIGLGKVFFIEKFRFSPQEASAINSIVYIISAPMSPVFGLLVDKVGKNIIWVLCAVVTTLASHIMLAFTFWNPWIAMHAVHPEPGPGSDCHSSWHDPGHQGIPVPGGLLQCLCVLVSASCGHAVLCQSPHRAEEQERLRRQNEDDLAKLLPKADAFSLRNKYLSKLGAQLPAHYSSCFSTLAHRSVLK